MNKTYYSKYSGEYCTVAQYLTEILLERKYKNTKLPFKFWNDSKYKPEYTKTIIQINKFLKIYNQEVLVNMFTKNSWLYSVYHPKVKVLLEQEEQTFLKIQERINKSEQIQGSTTIGNNMNKPNKQNKLKNLD